MTAVLLWPVCSVWGIDRAQGAECGGGDKGGESGFVSLLPKTEAFVRPFSAPKNPTRCC